MVVRGPDIGASHATTLEVLGISICSARCQVLPKILEIFKSVHRKAGGYNEANFRGNGGCMPSGPIARGWDAVTTRPEPGYYTCLHLFVPGVTESAEANQPARFSTQRSSVCISALISPRPVHSGQDGMVQQQGEDT